MMRIRLLKKLLVTGLLTFTILGSGVTPVMAYQASAKPTSASCYDEIVPFADVFRTYTRILNGVLQYRIWNATRGRWETDWRDV